jgi:hypothetical protein
VARDPISQLTAQASNSKGLPPGFKVFSPWPFAGMNQQDGPIAIADQEFTYNENFFPIGKGQLRTAWDVGQSVYLATGGLTIVSFFFYTISTTFYCAIFFSDGSAVQLDIAAETQLTIGGPGTFYNGANGQLPACAQWGVIDLLISNNNTVNDYWAWDGSLLYGAGTAAPNGVILLSDGNNYGTQPTVTPFGGHGNGLVVEAFVQAGGVVEAIILNPGQNYQVGDIVQLAFSGGGSDTSAQLVATLESTGVTAVNVTAGGVNYSAPVISFTGGGGTGAAATAVLGPPVGGSPIIAITNGSPGQFYEDPIVTITGGGGTGATATANLEPGGVERITVENNFVTYTFASPPTVTLVGGGGSGALAVASVFGNTLEIDVRVNGSGYTSPPTVILTPPPPPGSDPNLSFEVFIGGGPFGTGAITSYTITNGGSGYISLPTVTVTDAAGTGIGAVALPFVAGDVIKAINVTSPGSGYVTAPTVVITDPTGTGASAQASLEASSVGNVTVVNGGTGFIYAPIINFVGGGGVGATGVVNLTGTTIATVNMVSGGQLYTAPPVVTFVTGGGGSGATGTAVMADGQVIAVNLTNPGSGYTNNVEVVFTNATADKTGVGAGAIVYFTPTSIASVTISNYGKQYTTAPAIEVLPGANNSAYATVTLMPYGVSGAAMETFQQRVWIADPAPAPFSTLPPGGDWQVSAPQSLTDFATSDGGVQFTNFDGFLQTRYTDFRQSSGYLYAFGDGSVSVISSVNTSGNPSTTTFNYQNVDPQTGLSWRDARQDFGRSLLMANETGVYGLYGGAVTKVSGKLDQFFKQALFPPTAGALSPTAAIATVFNIKHYLMLMTIDDPDSGSARNVMATWNERDWFVTSQSANLNYIGTQKVESVYTAWGTDGQNLYPLFQTPSHNIAKRLDTKVYGGDQPLMFKNFLGLWMSGQDRSVQSFGIDCNFTFNISGVADEPTPATPTIDMTSMPSLTQSLILSQPSFQAPYPYWPVFGTGSGGAPFTAIQALMTTNSPDFILGSLAMGYTDIQAFYAG